MDKFSQLDEDVLNKFMETFRKKAFPINISFQFIGSQKQKGLIKISKIQDMYEFILEKQLLVSINQELFDSFDTEAVEILFEQEIDKISINIETGKIKLIKPDLTTFSSLIKKWGIESVGRANSVELLAVEQKDDKESELI